MRLNHLLTLFLLLSITGCMPFSPAGRNPVPESTPSSFSLYSETSVSTRSPWWLEFNNDELNSLMELTLSDNFDLREAYARLRQADAVRASYRAGLFPTVSGSAGYDRQETGNRDTGTRSTQDTLSIGIAAGYEVDLWGRVRSLNESGQHMYEAAAEDVTTAAMTVTANIAELWVDIITTRREIAYIEERIRINEALLSLLELRFEKGLATAMDVLHQKEALSGIRAQLPKLKSTERVYENELATLVGKSPGQPFIVTQKTIPDIPPVPESGLPADLLAMRPDIRSAGLKLKAAEWEISAAKADRLPALSLSASGSFHSTSASDIFSNWVTNLAANLTGPIFDAGRRKAEVQRTRAVAEERIATYEKTVLTAIKEVENALVQETHQNTLLEALEVQLEASRLSLREATRRYRTGKDTYITMQEKMLNVETTEYELIRQKAALIKYRISLYRALGGTWNPLDATR